MQQFDILGNVKVTAEVKTKIDDSPIVENVPQNMGLLDNNSLQQQNIQDNSAEYLKNNNAILQEFGTVISDVIRSFQSLNDKIRENINSPKIPTGIGPSPDKTIFMPVNNLGDDDDSNITNIIENVNPIESSEDAIKGKTFIQSTERVSGQNEDVNLNDNFQLLNDNINNSSESLKDNIDYVKQFGVLMPDMIKNFQVMNDIVNRTNQNLPAIGKVKTREEVKKQQLSAYNQQNLLGMLNTGGNMIQSAAGGNIGGSIIQGVSGVASTANNLSKMANIEDMTGLAKGLVVGGGVLMAGAAVLKGGKALADAYKDAMPTIFSTGKAFGTTDDNKSMALYNTVNKNNEGTGLDLREFNSLVVDLRKQGVGNNLKNDYAQAAYTSSIAETTAKWAYATGGDVTQYTNLAGIMSRYGKSKDVSNDFNYLVTAGKASGLNDSQIPEFLSNIQKVMEDGIANGFSRSATEVADTLLMFSKMSGNNAFWQSEKGAKMLSQANSGLANATGLNKTSDIIAYSAISKAYTGYATDENGNPILDENGKKISKEKAVLGNDLYQDKGDYVNKMMLLEQGLNPQNFGSIMSSLIDVEGKENVTGQIERLREMFGLNYTGASRLLKLYQDNGGNVDDSKIKNVMQAPENQNAETKWQKSVNQIAESIQKMGQPVFKVELGAMSGIASDVSRIANFIIKPEGKTKEAKAQVNPVENPMYTPKKKEFSEEYNEKKEEVNTKALENFDAGQKVLLNDYTQQYWGNDPNGEHFEAAYDFVENYDSVNQLWNQTKPHIVKRTTGTGLTKKGREKDLKDNPYELAPFATEKDIDPLTTVLGLPETHDKYASLLAGGKVSPQVFMSAIATSKEMSDSVKGATNFFDRQYSTKDLEKINNTLEKIFSELENGVNYTETK